MLSFESLKLFINHLNFYIMNKGQLIETIANDASISKAEAAKAVDSFIKTTTSTLKNGENLTLVGFGSWTVNRRKSRTGRNPQTGQPINIPEKNVVKFKAGSNLVSSIN